jgi:hypothetical protein
MGRARPSIEKRRKEEARKQRQRVKEARRAERAAEKEKRGDEAPPDEDPDIAGIIPGPQPVPWADELGDEEPEGDESA